MSFHIIAISALLTFATDLGGNDVDLAAQQQQLLDEYQPPLTTQHPPHIDGRSYRAMNLPPEMTHRELERYRHTLLLSDAQFAVLESLFDRYEQANTQLQEERLRDLWELSAAAGEYGPAVLHDSEAAATHLEMIQARNEYIDRAVAIEREMFDDLETVLADIQQQRMQRVRDQRARARLSSHRMRADMAMIDLSEMLHQLEPLDAPDADALSNALAEYERSAVQILQEYDRAWVRSNTRGVQRRVEGEVAASQSFLRRANDLTLRMAALNDRYHTRLGELLPSQHHGALEQKYLVAAYPGVMPDPYDITEILLTVMESDSLSDDQRLALDELHEQYVQRQAVLSRRMIQVTDGLVRHVLRTNLTDDAEQQRAVQRLDELQGERATHAQTTLTIAKEILSDTLEDMSEVFTAFHEQLERRQRHTPRFLGLSYYP